MWTCFFRNILAVDQVVNYLSINDAINKVENPQSKGLYCNETYNLSLFSESSTYKTIDRMIIHTVGYDFLPFKKEDVKTLRNALHSLHNKYDLSIVLTHPNFKLVIVNEHEFKSKLFIDNENIIIEINNLMLSDRKDLNLFLMDSIYKSKLEIKSECGLVKKFN